MTRADLERGRSRLRVVVNRGESRLRRGVQPRRVGSSHIRSSFFSTTTSRSTRPRLRRLAAHDSARLGIHRARSSRCTAACSTSTPNAVAGSRAARRIPARVHSRPRTRTSPQEAAPVSASGHRCSPAADPSMVDRTRFLELGGFDHVVRALLPRGCRAELSRVEAWAHGRLRAGRPGSASVFFDHPREIVSGRDPPRSASGTACFCIGSISTIDPGSFNTLLLGSSSLRYIAVHAATTSRIDLMPGQLSSARRRRKERDGQASDQRS